MTKTELIRAAAERAWNDHGGTVPFDQMPDTYRFKRDDLELAERWYGYLVPETHRIIALDDLRAAWDRITSQEMNENDAALANRLLSAIEGDGS